MAIREMALAAALAAWGGTALAEETGCDWHGEDAGLARLCTYEPNTIGYTRDSDDVGFMDFKLSVRYQLFPGLLAKGLNHVGDGLGGKYALYGAFTGRFGQYLGTRDSSPVIGKRFNPKIFLRRWSDETYTGYLDFAYAHESNGQSIKSLDQYRVAQEQQRAASGRPDFANDQLSRGWDYLEMVWKKADYASVRGLSSYVDLKYFLPHGLLQGKAEEYNGIEASPAGKPRNEVNGVGGLLKHHRETERYWIFKDLKTAFGYETGYRRPLRYNTFRLELGTKIMELPVNAWLQRGYNSDLAQYYKKVTSKGIEVQIGSF